MRYVAWIFFKRFSGQLPAKIPLQISYKYRWYVLKSFINICGKVVKIGANAKKLRLMEFFNFLPTTPVNPFGPSSHLAF